MQQISINSFPEKEEELLGKNTLNNINLMKKTNEYIRNINGNKNSHSKDG